MEQRKITTLQKELLRLKLTQTPLRVRIKDLLSSLEDLVSTLTHTTSLTHLSLTGRVSLTSSLEMSRLPGKSKSSSLETSRGKSSQILISLERRSITSEPRLLESLMEQLSFLRECSNLASLRKKEDLNLRLNLLILPMRKTSLSNPRLRAKLILRTGYIILKES